MAPKGITYTEIPDECYNLILDTQTEMKKKPERKQVSMSAALTKILKDYIKLTKGK